MPYVDVASENSTRVELYYEDQGTGDPVVLIHGWPLSGRSWEKQVPALLEGGFRVITYDRRGFGESSKPATGYDYDTFANDLDTLLRKLDLNRVTLVGFSMGGGEVARYLGKYGADRIKRAVFVSAISPFLLKTKDNPDGVDGKLFDEIKKGIIADRPSFLSGFLANFYNMDQFKGSRISPEACRLSWNIAAVASPIGTLECVNAWLTDFRQELAKVQIPVLVVHGDSDRIVPAEASAKRMPSIIRGAQLKIISGAPHGLNWTHAGELNRELIGFLSEGVRPIQKAG